MARLLLLTAILSALALACAGSAPAPTVPTDAALPGLDLAAELARGEPVVLVWWLPWCESCAHEAPGLALAAKRFAGRLRFFGIVPGGEQDAPQAEVEAFVLRHGIGYPTVRDRTGDFTRSFRVDGTPTILVLDPSGEVRYRGSRAPDWNALVGA
ncbi:MAG: TlpA family protein disulfide reductase [Planctomycetota bacterium]|nr:MAG: TlpA family protein disulfide reductase [Planctomycetota bacterium]